MSGSAPFEFTEKTIYNYPDLDGKQFWIKYDKNTFVGGDDKFYLSENVSLIPGTGTISKAESKVNFDGTITISVFLDGKNGFPFNIRLTNKLYSAHLEYSRNLAIDKII
jgi:hypothetical protein